MFVKAPTESIRKYQFQAIVWRYKGPAGWYFVTLPKSLSKKIRSLHGRSEEGWGRLKTSARIGQTEWKTAIWYDSKLQSYILPLKLLIRKKEKIELDSKVKIRLSLTYHRGF